VTAVTTLTVAAFGVTACSSSSGGSNATGAVAGCTGNSTGVTKTGIKLGVLTVESGAAAQTFDGFQQGIQARIDAQNAQGGVNGRKLSIVTADDADSGSQQVTSGEALVQNDGAFGVMAGTAVDTVFPYFQQNDVPVTGLATFSPYGSDNNVFGITGAYLGNLTPTVIPSYLKEHGITSVAVLAHDDPGSIGTQQAVIRAAKSLGMTVPYAPESIPLGAFDATSVALALKQSGAQAVVAPLLASSSVSIAQAVKAQGVTGLKDQVYYSTYDPNVLHQADGALNGTIADATSGAKPLQLSDPAVKQYLSTMQQYGESAHANETYAAIGYLAAGLFIHGLQLAGNCLTRQNFVTTLRNSSGWDANGLAYYSVNFKPGLTPDGNPSPCQWFLNIENGQFVPEAKASCSQVEK
jgi:ABC-type branched-subunit amino acid transport system substrate-binding protein